MSILPGRCFSTACDSFPVLSSDSNFALTRAVKDFISGLSSIRIKLSTDTGTDAGTQWSIYTKDAVL